MYVCVLTHLDFPFASSFFFKSSIKNSDVVVKELLKWLAHLTKADTSQAPGGGLSNTNVHRATSVCLKASLWVILAGWRLYTVSQSFNTEVKKILISSSMKTQVVGGGGVSVSPNSCLSGNNLFWPYWFGCGLSYFFSFCQIKISCFIAKYNIALLNWLQMHAKYTCSSWEFQWNLVFIFIHD